MTGEMVSWRDYDGMDGSGGNASPMSMDELSQLRKALISGSDRDPVAAGPGVGFPLRIESLEHTLRNTTWRMEHIKLWRQIPKSPAFNTVEEYNQIQSYGQSDLGAFIDEGALPEETDAQYERKFSFVKFMGTTRRVTHVMSLVKNAAGNAIAAETIAGTMRLLESIERALYFADSSLDPVQWDGFEKLIRDGSSANNIIDLRGKGLSEDVLSDASLTVSDSPNYGTPTHLFCSPKAKQDFVKGFFPRARYDQFSHTNNGMIGLGIRGFTSDAGDIRIEPETFLDDGGGVAGIAAVGEITKRPALPSFTTAPTGGSGGGSLFGSGDAGLYWYSVIAVNKFGQSAPVEALAAATVTAGQIVTMGITPGSGPLPSYYKIFRTAVGGAAGTERLILRVPNTTGAGALTVTDLNASLPGTTKAFMFQLNQENMTFKQLAPMIKVPLATVDTSVRWMQLVYGTPVLYTPRHNVMFINVGRSPDYVGAP